MVQTVQYLMGQIKLLDETAYNLDFIGISVAIILRAYLSVGLLLGNLAISRLIIYLKSSITLLYLKASLVS